MKIIIEPVHLYKEDKELIKNFQLSFNGVEKIFKRETGFDYREATLLIQDYLSKKIMALRMKKRKLEEEIEMYNKATEMARQLDVKTNINGEPLKKIKLEFSEVFKWD